MVDPKGDVIEDTNPSDPKDKILGKRKVKTDKSRKGKEKMNEEYIDFQPMVAKILETDEARRRFPNAKSISSAQLHRDMDRTNETLSRQPTSSSTTNLIRHGVGNLSIYSLVDLLKQVVELLKQIDCQMAEDSKTLAEFVEKYTDDIISMGKHILGSWNRHILGSWNRLLYIIAKT